MPMMRSSSFESVITQLDSAIGWVASHDVRSRPSRYATYLETIQRIEKRWREGATRADEISVDPVLMETAFREGIQLIRIATAFRGRHVEGMLPKLKRLIDGPVLEGDERSSNSGHVGRDTGFELEVAAYFSSAGYVEFPPDIDLVLHAGGISYYFECKRPSSPQKLRPNLNRARTQLIHRLSQTRMTSYGVVALSASKVHWSPGALLTVTSVASLRDSVTVWLARFDREHITTWLHAQPDNRLAAVLVHLPYTAYVGDSPPISTSEFFLLGRHGRGSQLAKDLRRLTVIANTAVR